MSKTIQARIRAIEHIERAARCLSAAGLYGDAQDVRKAIEPLKLIVERYHPEVFEGGALTMKRYRVWREGQAPCQGSFATYEEALAFVKQEANWNRWSTREYEITAEEID